MNLDELRKLANSDNTETDDKTPEPAPEPDAPPVEPEPEQQDDDDSDSASESKDSSDGDESEESDSLELELEGDTPTGNQNKPNSGYDPVKVLEHKLGKERRKKREAREEVDELREQVRRLEQQLNARSGTTTAPATPQSNGSAAEPTIPDLYDKGIDGDRQKYDAAMKKWFADYQAYQNRHKQAEDAQENHRTQMANMTKELAQRAAKFAADNRVKVDTVADALQRATDEIDDATGIDGALAFLLSSVGDGGERVAYYLGTNNAALDQVKGLLRDDPQGFKAITHMTRLAEKLKPKQQKQVSKAPEPDQPLKGDSSSNSPSAKKLQDEWKKATTPEQMLSIRRKARELGIKLS